MKASLRRIATSTLVVGLLALSVVTVTQLVSYCGSGQPSCMVAAVKFGVMEYQATPVSLAGTQAISTDQMSTDPSMIEALTSVIQVMSVYLILFSVIVLVILEAFELRYLRQLLGRRHA